MSVIRVLVFLVTFLTGVRACPTRCLCFRTTVRCMFLQLETIPQVKTDTTILDLRFNKIKSIPVGTFRNLNRLTTLLLNNNEIEKLEEGSFMGLNEVKYIYLYKNKIRNIGEKTFRDTPKIEQLYLHNNILERLPKGIFKGLSSLRRLRLDSNALVCDCQLMWLANMLKEKHGYTQAAATCQFPEKLQGRSLMSISQDDFHCKGPQFVMEPRDVDVTFGNTAYFTCRAEGSPDPEIVWLHNQNEIDVERNDRYSMLQDGTLMIQDTQGSDQGVYECIARNIAGEIKTNRVELRYFGEPASILGEARRCNSQCWRNSNITVSSNRKSQT
ncbi:peroxidasin [Patella vulgata]|uniref:peroxidasin n=1 Tax=Patella vulgata TaxID=6465 RepID=UPI00217FC920|nr:peroxidasin [Patella vulgata]